MHPLLHPHICVGVLSIQNDSFSPTGSDSEISYGNLRLSVLSFQDDALRMCSSVESIQKGNIYMESVMKRKQLSLGIEKCSVIGFGRKKNVELIRETINNSQKLKLCNQDVRVKENG